MWNNRLKAFTLVEIIVSLTIASVVTLMAAFGFNTIVDISDRTRYGLSDSESDYFLLADFERNFKKVDVPRVQFNDVVFDGVMYELGLETSVRKQLDRIDTMNSVVFGPKLSLSVISADPQFPLLDSLTFSAQSGSFTLIRQGSMADNINRMIGYGQD